MYSKLDYVRYLDFGLQDKSFSEEYRSQFRIDYARLVHSPSFRRLQGKTQLFPANESDYFRNRLTHSLEVAQISKSIAIKINHEFLDNKNKLDTDLVEFAALAHDIGHPPFGHQGEEALDNNMINYGGFEGNAQTLRLLSIIEKKFQYYNYPKVYIKGNDVRVGLNLTFRSLASILKYDNPIPTTKKGREKYRIKNGEKVIKPVKGYYESESNLVENIKRNVLNGQSVSKFKTIECQIMDIADDIAYSTYDFDDTLKSGFCSPFDILLPNGEVLKKVEDSIRKNINSFITSDKIKDVLFTIFERVFAIPLIKDFSTLDQTKFNDIGKWMTETNVDAARQLVTNSFIRHSFTSNLIHEFINGIEFEFNSEYPALSKVQLNEEVRLKVEILKKFNYQLNIQSSRLKISAYRGKEIIDKIFGVLTNDELKGFELLPSDFRSLYESNSNKKFRYRLVCDFIAGMTDRYCIEFYARLTSENPETIFKPI